MATTAVQIPPSNIVLPGSRLLPTAPLPDTHSTLSSLPPSSTSFKSIVEVWIFDLNKFLSGDQASIAKLFFEESYWRDLLCMTWDFHTLQGPVQISKSIQSSPQDRRLTLVSLDESSAHKLPQASDFGGLKAVQAFLKVETTTGRGEGLVRLVSDTNDGGKWKALTLFTTLKELKGYEENVSSRRPQGTESSPEDKSRNWKDLLVAQHNFEGGRQPTVLILGMLLRIMVAEICELIDAVQVLARVGSQWLVRTFRSNLLFYIEPQFKLQDRLRDQERLLAP